MSASEVTRVLSSTGANATQAIAAKLAAVCGKGDCLLLKGDLGAGKTTFARGFIRHFSPDEEVVSPTFTLMQTYAAGEHILHHFDLYRLKNKQEIIELGLAEALENGITLIEWPEIAQSELPESALSVTLSINKRLEQRQIIFSGRRAAWQEKLAGLEE